MFENSKSTEVLFAREKNDTTYFYSLSRIYGWILIATTNWITCFMFNIPVHICSRAESTNRVSKNYLIFSLTCTNLTLLESLSLPESEYKHLFVEKIKCVMGGLGIWECFSGRACGDPYLGQHRAPVKTLQKHPNTAEWHPGSGVIFTLADSCKLLNKKS